MSRIRRIVTAARGIVRYTWTWIQPVPDSDFWSRPPDLPNRHDAYAYAWPRSFLLVGLVAPRLPPDARILEIGCNVGRNLEALRLAGYRDLTGVEISRDALDAHRTYYPDSRARLVQADVTRDPLDLPPADLVFSMAVLMHIPPASEEVVFRKMATLARRWIISIEDESPEHASLLRYYPRRYDAVWPSLGFEQVEERSCADVPGLGAEYVARVFRRGAG